MFLVSSSILRVLEREPNISRGLVAFTPLSNSGPRMDMVSFLRVENRLELFRLNGSIPMTPELFHPRFTPSPLMYSSSSSAILLCEIRTSRA